MNTRTLQVVAEGARQQNLLAPVSRLPPELVLHIFSYVKAAVTLESKHVYRINEVNRRKWIMLTHIFHLWRDIALCTPSLWSNIHISEFDYKWANTMLQRSQHVPLNVHVNFEGFARRTRKYKHIKEPLSILEENVGRCKILSLYNVQPEAFGRFFPPNHDALQLRTLRLSSHPESFDRDVELIVLSDHTLHVGALRRLTLIGYELDWSSSFLRGLTHLKIRACLSDSSDAGNLLQTLPEMTSLELLDLDGTVEFALAIPQRLTSSQCVDPISIPTLKNLRIQSSMENVAAFLSVLILPSTVNIFLNADHDEEDGFGHYFMILFALSRIFAPALPPTRTTTSTLLPTQNHAKSFRIIRGEDYTSDLRIQAFRAVLTQDDLLTCAPSSSFNTSSLFIDCTFTFDFEFHSLQEAQVTHALTEVLPLDYVVTLQVIGELLLPPSVWAERFGRIPGLRSVLLGDYAVPYDMFEALMFRVAAVSSSSGNQSGGESTTLPFLFLDTILLHGYGCGGDTERVLDEFSPKLEDRRAIGLPIRRVVLIDCELGGDSPGMLRLRNAVELVEELELNLDFEEMMDNAVADLDSELEDEDEACFG